MTSNTMLKINEGKADEDLAKLQKENAKGSICVSIITPTHRLSPERIKDSLELEKAISHAKQILKEKYEKSLIGELYESLDDLFNSIDFSHNSEGIGLFVSPQVKLKVQFPFRVEPKVLVADHFEMRDLLYKAEYSIPYFVLMLTEKGAHFFRGSGKVLKEIEDDHFPLDYEENYEYSKPSRTKAYSASGAHVKSFEKEKSAMKEIRQKSFLKQVDESIHDVITNETPLVVMGTEKELAWFEEISDFPKERMKNIRGSYGHHNPTQLAEIVWPVIQEQMHKKQEELIQEFEEKLGEHRGISGIQEVWQAAKEGRGLKLLVEKDYRCHGFIDKDAYQLYLRRPAFSNRELPDAVQEIVEMLLQAQGNVFFLENDSLKQYDQIALITRY